jgi:hypothetical protein
VWLWNDVWCPFFETVDFSSWWSKLHT